MNILTKEIPAPTATEAVVPVDLTAETMRQRQEQLFSKMDEQQLDVVVIYADREHGANFEYFTGFIPRFEEALLVMHRNRQAFLLLGNENTKMVNYSRIAATLIHTPFFSLPNQPMENDAPFETYLKQAGIEGAHKVAVVGWKNFTSTYERNQQLFDVPNFILEGLKKVVKDSEQLMNGSNLLISPEAGLRTVNNANEIAHYEFGATLAGKAILDTINSIEIGKTELELASNLAKFGQPNNVTTICATGERFTNATLYPRSKSVKLGDPFSTSVGYKGGLSSRAAYVAESRKDLPAAVSDYEEKIAKPYFKALATWLETMKIGATGASIYSTISEVLPKESYHWELNPGHYVADEEWLSSPFYEGSKALIKSGQMFQIDIIPKVEGYGGVGCEDGIALADGELRAAIKTNYPEVWKRISKRREYLKTVLNFNISEEILPLNDIVGYYRPYLLNQELAFCLD
ncbi:MAG: M24 family metallopeptidase [Enterococcus avium]